MVYKFLLRAVIFMSAFLASCGLVGKTRLPKMLNPKVAHFERDVTYAVVDGKELKLDVFWPEGKGPFPMIINIPGGAWYKENEEWLREPICRYLCNRGYVVFNVTYRHAPEYRFPAQVNDVLGAIIFTKTNAAKYNGDPNRVAIMGDSAGANLAALAANVWDDPYYTPSFSGNGRYTAHTDATVLLFGVYDLVKVYNMSRLYAVIFENPKEVAQRYLGGTPDQMPEQYRRASPLYSIRPNMSPTLIVCGSNDPLLSHSVALHEKLTEMGVPHGFYISEGDNHGFTMYPPPFTLGAMHCFAAINAFLDLVLGSGK